MRSPWLDLARAVLEQALADATGGRQGGRPLARDAAAAARAAEQATAWLLDKAPAGGRGLPFALVAEALGLDPDGVRSHVRRRVALRASRRRDARRDESVTSPVRKRA